MSAWFQVLWSEVRGWRRSRRPAAGSRARLYRPAFDELEARCLLASLGGYLQTNLVADQPGIAQIQDLNLVNAWGIAEPPTGGSFWLSDNATGLTTLYSGAVAGRPLALDSLIVRVPGGALTGQVFNGTNDFVIHSGSAQAPAMFLFASESGQVTGWNPFVPAPAPSTLAQTAFSATDGAIFTGIALGSTETGNFLYLADFHNGRIDVLDGSFHLTTLAGSFSDPNLPAGYAPFNIQELGGRLYVTYAQQDGARRDAVPGAGSGFVDVFDTDGRLLQRLGSGGALDAPWALALAPGDFGEFSNDLLVGNLGDGRINAFDPHTGAFLGPLRDAAGSPIAIDGLWGLGFGNGVSAGEANVLYFAAGPDHETHGLFGALQAADALKTPRQDHPAAQNVYGIDSPDPDAADYPLPPTTGPTFRGAVAPQPDQLPVVLPLKDLPLAQLPAVPAVENAAATVTPADAAGPNRGAVAAGPAFGKESQLPRMRIPVGETAPADQRGVSGHLLTASAELESSANRISPNVGNPRSETAQALGGVNVPLPVEAIAGVQDVNQEATRTAASPPELPSRVTGSESAATPALIAEAETVQSRETAWVHKLLPQLVAGIIASSVSLLWVSRRGDNRPPRSSTPD